MSILRRIDAASEPDEVALVRKYRTRGLVRVRSEYGANGLITRDFGHYDAQGQLQWETAAQFFGRIEAEDAGVVANEAAAQLARRIVGRLNRPGNTALATLPQEERDVVAMTGNQYRAFCAARGGTANMATHRYRYHNGAWVVLQPDAAQPFLGLP